MDILYYNDGEDDSLWIAELKKALPESAVRLWKPGDTARADYLLVWGAPEEFFTARDGVKAVIVLAAGVDSFLKTPGIPAGVPVYRLEDAGMGIQLAQYAAHAVLRFYRRFDAYEAMQKEKRWETIVPAEPEDFVCSVMGAGRMGLAVANVLKTLGFTVRVLSRAEKPDLPFETFTPKNLDGFLSGANALVNVLPLTADTRGILGKKIYDRLDGALLVNLGRGAHFNEQDTLDALSSGRLAHVATDVAPLEPSPADSPFWSHPKITMTPHIAGLTYCRQTVAEVAAMVRAIESGTASFRPVDRTLGY